MILETEFEMPVDPVTIEFPCPNYPVKVIAEHRTGLQADVEACLSELGVSYAAQVQSRDSRAARFLALTFMITAQSEAQLRALNTAVRAVPGVRLVL